MISARPFVIIGTPEDQHVTLFQEALARLDLPPALVIAYTDLLEKRVNLDTAIPPNAIVRIDSPGKSWEVNRALAIRGSEKKHYPHFPALDDPREYIPSWAWYAGFCMALEPLQALQKHRNDILWVNPLPDIRLMLDRAACCKFLKKRDVPIPDWQTRWHGSTLMRPRYQSGQEGWATLDRYYHSVYEAVSTTLLLEEGKLINAIHPREMQDESVSRKDKALQFWWQSEAIHETTRLARATLSGNLFDLRVVMVAGRMRHIAARTSKTQLPYKPLRDLDDILNNTDDDHDGWGRFWRRLPRIRDFLPLVKTRSVSEKVRDRISKQVWRKIERIGENVASLFPNSLALGIDLVISASWTKPYVMEVNPFGNPMPNLLHEGDDTYTAEIKAALARADETREDNA